MYAPYIIFTNTSQLTHVPQLYVFLWPTMEIHLKGLHLQHLRSSEDAAGFLYNPNSHSTRTYQQGSKGLAVVKLQKFCLSHHVQNTTFLQVFRKLKKLMEVQEKVRDYH